MMQFAAPDGGRPDYQTTVCDRIRYGLEFLCLCQNVGGAHRRARLAKRDLIRIDEAQVLRPEITHGSSRRPNIEWVAYAHKYDVQMIQVAAHNTSILRCLLA